MTAGLSHGFVGLEVIDSKKNSLFCIALWLLPCLPVRFVFPWHFAYTIKTENKRINTNVSTLDERVM